MNKFENHPKDLYYCGMLNLEVVLSPALLHLSDAKGKNVVVIDILRATSTICTAIHHGVESVLALSKPEQALLMKASGYITAAERDGYKMDGFDMGNSPFECMSEALKGQKIALTTTNGTKCIEAVQKSEPHDVYAGSFLNLNALSKRLIAEKKDVLLLCAGWKDNFNLEDTLYAGAMAHSISQNIELEINCDATWMAMDLYEKAKNDMVNYLKKSSHYKRLSHLSHEEDMVYCMQNSVFETITGLVGNEMKKK